VLEQRRITRVGGADESEVDVRVICATPPGARPGARKDR
jgi:transcriptional regulator of acetoin/glycerol metabolism